MAGTRATSKVGMVAAGSTAAFSIAYVVAQICEWMGLLGSAGGPASTSTPFGLVILLLPSLLLGSSYLITIAALHQIVSTDRRTFSLTAFGFAIAYATLTGLVYFVQLTFVGPRLAAGETAGIELLLFVPYQSFLFAIDLLGYALMCASTLFASFALRDQPGGGVARLFLFLNGLLMPALLFQMLLPQLIWIGALWAIFFPAAAISLCLLFQKIGRDADRRI